MSALETRRARWSGPVVAALVVISTACISERSAPWHIPTVTVSGLSATPDTGRIYLTWAEVPGAEFYEIQYGPPGGPVFLSGQLEAQDFCADSDIPQDDRRLCDYTLQNPNDGSALEPGAQYDIVVLVEGDERRASPVLSVSTLPVENTLKVFQRRAVFAPGGALANEQHGWAVAARDMDGDGADDVLVAGPGYEGTGPSSPCESGLPDTDGVVSYLPAVPGDTGAPVRPNISPADTTRIGPGVGGGYGLALAAADVDGSGSAEFLIGSPLEGTEDGNVYFFRPGGGHPAVTKGNGTRMGASVSCTPDDALCVIGAPRDPAGGGVDRGVVYELTGDFAIGPSVAEGSNDNARLGRAALVGYLNEDAFPDVVVASISGGGDGQVAFIPGAAPGFTDAVNLPSGTALNDPSYGTALAWGDVNSDGIGDLVVGSPDAGSGGVRVFLGPVSPGTFVDIDAPAVLQSGANSTARFGHALAVGDVNADGVDDIIVSAPFATDPTGGAQKLGMAFVYFGSLNPMGDPAFTQPDGPVLKPLDDSEPIHFGYSLAIGDVSADGTADIIIGAPCAKNGLAMYAGGVAVQHGVPSTGPWVDFGVNLVIEPKTPVSLPLFWGVYHDWLYDAETSTGFECTVQWGDGASEGPLNEVCDQIINGTLPEHRYQAAGVYALEVRIDAPHFSLGGLPFEAAGISKVCVGQDFALECAGQNGAITP